jgi:arabinose-5-phosphate isomerase
MGDALAVALLQRRGFKEQDFAQFHPGGSLGRRLLVKVRDLMHAGDRVPRIGQDVSATDAILEMTAKKLGMTTVVAASGTLVGVITDGDLRRFVEKGGDFRGARAADLVTRNPKTIGPDELAARALDMMERFSITSLVVMEPSGTIAGVIHLHDLLRNGIV